MEERLAQVEKAIEQLQLENERLKQDVAALQDREEHWRQELEDLAGRLPVESTPDDSTTPSGRWKGQMRRRWPLVAVALTIAVPLVALSVWHLDAFWSTAIAFLNGILLYYIGPRAWALLIEGLFRAIPGVLFGQATRIAVDKYRTRRQKPGA